MSLMNRDSLAPEKWFGDLPVTNRYTLGLAGEIFYRAIKDQAKIMGTYCPKCNHTYVPPSIFCERCFAELNEWVDVGIIGELHTFTLLYENLDGSRLEKPQIVGFIKLGDGGIIHYLGEISPDDIYIGMPLKAKFKPQKDRVGAITDIEYFFPAV
jgi:uncharacterized OB-fold protein